MSAIIKEKQKKRAKKEPSSVGSTLDLYGNYSN